MVNWHDRNWNGILSFWLLKFSSVSNMKSLGIRILRTAHPHLQITTQLKLKRRQSVRNKLIFFFILYITGILSLSFLLRQDPKSQGKPFVYIYIYTIRDSGDIVSYAFALLCEAKNTCLWWWGWEWKWNSIPLALLYTPLAIYPFKSQSHPHLLLIRLDKLDRT
jgi:hypothetical protein